LLREVRKRSTTRKTTLDQGKDLQETLNKGVNYFKNSEWQHSFINVHERLENAQGSFSTLASRIRRLIIICKTNPLKQIINNA